MVIKKAALYRERPDGHCEFERVVTIALPLESAYHGQVTYGDGTYEFGGVVGDTVIATRR